MTTFRAASFGDSTDVIVADSSESDLAESIVEHARRYRSLARIDAEWLDGHIAVMAPRSSILPRDEPMVAAQPPNYSNRQDMPTEMVQAASTQPTPPAPPQPPERGSWFYRSWAYLLSFVVVTSTLVTLYWLNITWLAFIVTLPAAIFAAIQRHVYLHRIDELAEAVVKEARYIKRYHREEYSDYFDEAAEALRDRGASQYVALFPSK